MLRRNHTALAYSPQADKLHPSVSPALARAFDGFFGPPARELRSSNPSVSPPTRKNHTALAPTPCPGISPEMKRAFDGFFGPPEREEAAAPVSARSDRRSIETLPPYESPEVRSPLPVYSVVGRY
ncbi:unnamed protein product [Rhizoctonia solani]|uniref:Uncharacterized protein n=3 Tax=Rhizoctonia solani TaxID=456999 RepID=A0A8H2WIU1_9AGAM|nr:hypothetical protein RSOL_429490 [Rhizoctonia solani AG-3 Rhs1AP]KEP53820.1 hypothetical protein V565_025690 [Rhizoctonia solani 123E]CAE6377884.1 unnamed protein product [Rhizoctonia solani]CAE6413216.1 unnamed protein product [Rhizoctonia solani]